MKSIEKQNLHEKKKKEKRELLFDKRRESGEK